MSEPANPVLRAITAIQSQVSCEIRVHLSRSLFEPDVFQRALHLFERYGLYQTTHHNGVLIYVNLRKKMFAVMADGELEQLLPSSYWEGLGENLRKDLLRGSSIEDALALMIGTLGVSLIQHFPIEEASS